MNVPRRLIGKIVEVQWMDPCEARLEIDAFKVGRAALASWIEYGKVHDITEGVVVIAHSLSTKAGMPDNAAPNELSYTAIPEVLIEKITVYEAIKET
jgi:hypothetical protein